MAKSQPRIIYGIHQLTPYNLKTGLAYGSLKVLGSSNFSLAGELESLNGGSSKFPYAVEETTISAELSITAKEYPDFLFELFLGKKPTSNASESAGSVSAITNKNGSSIADATTGIAAVGVKAGFENDVKFTKFVVKSVSATTIDVYALNSVDFGRGSVASYEDDLLKINSTPITITDGGTIDLPNFGLEFTGGSSVAMVADDTAIFESRPINSGSMEVVIGGTSDVFPEFGALAIAQKRGNGELVELDIYRLKGVGLPMPMAEKSFSEAEITAQAYLDACRGGVFSVRTINGDSNC